MLLGRKNIYTVFIEKKSRISGLMHFKPMLFKSQLYSVFFSPGYAHNIISSHLDYAEECRKENHSLIIQVFFYAYSYVSS